MNAIVCNTNFMWVGAQRQSKENLGNLSRFTNKIRYHLQGDLARAASRHFCFTRISAVIIKNVPPIGWILLVLIVFSFTFIFHSRDLQCDVKWFMRKQYYVLLLMFWGKLIACILRLNLSVAIVEMASDRDIVIGNRIYFRVSKKIFFATKFPQFSM